MPKSVRVPKHLEPLFDKAESYVQRRFDNLSHKPELGEFRVDGDRFVLMRAESLYVGLCDGFVRRFGDVAFELVYAMAWEIGSSDCQTLTARTGATDPVERIACGLPFFAYSGWASVELLDDSKYTSEADCLLHYEHPNTFESESLAKRSDVHINGPACFFSAGYSAGWGSCSLGLELQAREIRCKTQGAKTCEFVVAPAARLDELERDLKR